MTILASSTQAHTCYAKMPKDYALQRDIVELGGAFVESLAKDRSESLEELVLSLINAPAFRVRPGGEP